VEIELIVQFRVIRQKGTERPGSHPYDKKSQNDEGVYREYEMWRSYLTLAFGSVLAEVQTCVPPQLQDIADNTDCAACDAPLYTSKTKL
jgi:peptide methionine sulfoxide reductase MsrB